MRHHCPHPLKAIASQTVFLRRGAVCGGHRSAAASRRSALRFRWQWVPEAPGGRAASTAAGTLLGSPCSDCGPHRAAAHREAYETRPALAPHAGRATKCHAVRGQQPVFPLGGEVWVCSRPPSPQKHCQIGRRLRFVGFVPESDRLNAALRPGPAVTVGGTQFLGLDVMTTSSPQHRTDRKHPLSDHSGCCFGVTL